jgi:iron complex transport system substrate-binding protein
MMDKSGSCARFLIMVFSAMIAVSCTRNHLTSDRALPADRADCRTIVHQMGETELCGQPQNIVALGPYTLEILLSLGQQPAGFADHILLHQGDYDTPSEQIPYLGDRITTQPVNVGLAYTPSFESLLRVQPDLILATETNNSAQYPQLQSIAPTLVLKTFDAKANLRTVAQALGKADQGEQLIAATEQALATAKQTFAPIVAAHPQVLVLSSSDAQEFHLASSLNSNCGAVLEKLGFELVYPPGLNEANLRVPAPVSLETLPQLNDADSIILLGFNWESAHQPKSQERFQTSQLAQLQQQWQENSIAQSLSASQSGRVYFIPAYLCLGLPGAIGTELYLNELAKQMLPSQ